VFLLFFVVDRNRQKEGKWQSKRNKTKYPACWLAGWFNWAIDKAHTHTHTPYSSFAATESEPIAREFLQLLVRKLRALRLFSSSTQKQKQKAFITFWDLKLEIFESTNSNKRLRQTDWVDVWLLALASPFVRVNHHHFILLLL